MAEALQLLLERISTYAADYGLPLGQRACEEKSNEITAIEELLPALALEGVVVTIDAMGYQTAIAGQIVTGGGDYVPAVKDNQPRLAATLRDFFTSPKCTGLSNSRGRQLERSSPRSAS